MTENETIEEMGAELEKRRAEPVTVIPSVWPTPREWEAMRAMAATISHTPFVPSAFRGKPDDILAAILTGRELGLGPMHSLKQISIIEGRPALSAELMLAKLREGGVVLLASESTPERAYIHARRGQEEMEVEWTFAQAQQAGLVGKPSWKRYPEDMLWARAVGRLSRRLGPDLVGGFSYAAEEVADFEDVVEGDYETGPVGGERLVDPTKEWVRPSNWAELLDYFTRNDIDVEWVTESIKLRWPEAETKDDLTREQREVAFQKTWATFLRLYDEGKIGAPPGASRDEIATVFAKVWDGVKPEGPSWALPWTEEDRPTKDEWLAMEAAEAVVDPELEQIADETITGPPEERP
jgi:hypothetical protein